MSLIYYYYQNLKRFYFPIMKNDVLSHSMNLSELNYYKNHKSPDSLIICQCPCRQQIRQNQKINQLQSDYIKSLELQNLRRNEERIYLQAEIQQLRLELSQPQKEKEQLLGKIRYYKGEYQRAQNTYKQLEICMRNQQKQLMIKTDQINTLRSNTQKLQLQISMMQKHTQDLQQRLNKLYNQIDSRLPRERRNSITIKQQYSSAQLIQNINRKWQQYCQEVKFKIHSQMIKEIQKLTKENIELLNQKKQLQKKNQLLCKQVKSQKAEKDEIQRSYKNLQGSFKTIQEDSNAKILKYIQSNRTKLEDRIKQLEDQLFNQDMGHIKRSFSQEQFKLNSTSSIEEILKLQKQMVFVVGKMEDMHTQTDNFVQSECQTLQFQKQLRKQTQKIQQKDNQICKLKQKMQTMGKILQMLKSKTLQNQKDIYRCESKQIMEKNSNKVNKSSQNRQGQNINSIFTFLLSQYSCNAQITDSNIKKLQQIIKQKDLQIQSLDNANRVLKDMKMAAMQNSAKILQLQKENHKLKRQLAQTKEGLIRSRGSNKSHTKSIDGQNYYLGAKIPFIPNVNSQSHLYRSSVQAKQDYFYRSQYKSNEKFIQQKNKSNQIYDTTNQDMKTFLQLKQNNLDKNFSISERQKQESPTLRIKIVRVQSHQKLIKQ